MCGTLMEIDLTQDQAGVGDGAFRADIMAEEGLTNADMIGYLVKSLGPIAKDLGGFMREGAGFGVICETNDEGSFEVKIIGIAASAPSATSA